MNSNPYERPCIVEINRKVPLNFRLFKGSYESTWETFSGIETRLRAVLDNVYPDISKAFFSTSRNARAKTATTI